MFRYGKFISDLRHVEPDADDLDVSAFDVVFVFVGYGKHGAVVADDIVGIVQNECVRFVLFFDGNADLIRERFFDARHFQIPASLFGDNLADVLLFKEQVIFSQVLFLQLLLDLLDALGRGDHLRAARFVHHVELRNGTHGAERDQKYDDR